MDVGAKKSVRKWSLTFISGAFAVALAMLYVLVLRSVAVQLEPPPKQSTEPYPDISTQQKCEEMGGRWIATPEGKGVMPEKVAEPVPAGQEIREYCQGPLRFEREREQQSEDSQQMSLFVFAVGGAIAVASSLLIVQLKPVAPGLMMGGIVSFFVAGVHVWMLAPGFGRLATIVVIFIILTGIGIYVFREKDDGEVT
jgi:predicted PurR-regulated permease PerM